MHAFGAPAGAVYANHNGERALLYCSETGIDESSAAVVLPLHDGDYQVGALLLAARDDGAAYSEEDITMLAAAGSTVARALRFGDYLHGKAPSDRAALSEPLLL
jgi:hypothetical protein